MLATVHLLLCAWLLLGIRPGVEINRIVPNRPANADLTDLAPFAEFPERALADRQSLGGLPCGQQNGVCRTVPCAAGLLGQLC
jgi:hypothetical protein